MLTAANDMKAHDRATMPLIAIIDADSGARGAARCLLENEGYRVLSFASITAFLRASSSETPGCVLVDMQVPGRDGLDMLRQLASRPNCPPILIASAQAQLDVAVAAMKLGASDFLQKPYLPAEILRAIESLAPSADARERKKDERETIRVVDSLPRRQRQILTGIVRGLQNKVIAWELQLSVRTVEYYRALLFRRLGIRSVGEAVRIGLAAGLEP